MFQASRQRSTRRRSARSRVSRGRFRVAAACIAAAVLTLPLAAGSPPAAAANLQDDVVKLKKTVDDLKRALATQTRESKRAAGLDNRLKALEKKDRSFGKSPMAGDAKIAQMNSLLNSLAARVGALEQKVSQMAGPGSTPSMGDLDSRLDKIEGAVKITGGNVTLQASGKVSLAGSSAEVSAGTATFSGTVKSKTLITDSVVSKSYTPGAGNVW